MKQLTITDSKGHTLPVWTLDFETYYNTAEDYSLSKMTTTSYVRDERFRAHGASAVSPEGEEFWVTHDELPGFFASIDWSSVAMLGQNTAFDAFIAYEHYGVALAYYLDTMSMSLGEWGPCRSASLQSIAIRLGRKGKIKGELEKTDGIRVLSHSQELALITYAIQDSTETRGIFEEMYYDRGYPEKELHIIDLTIRAFAVPVLNVDAPLCRQEIEEEKIKLDRLLSSNLLGDVELSEHCKKVLMDKGVEGILSSNPCFAELLVSRGIAPPLKPSPSNPEKSTYAFNKTDLELIALGNDPRTSDLVAARIGSKSTIRRTRAERFLEHSVEGTRPLPVMLKYCGAKTFRWTAGEKTNLQNLPSGRKGESDRLRKALVAPKGFRLVRADASQIEVRVNAWLWGQQDLLRLFAEHDDPYCQLASTMYGVSVTKNGPNAHLRPMGKAAELGLGYGMGSNKYLYSCLSGAITGDIIQLDADEALRAVTTYRAVRNKIKEGWSILQESLAMMALKADPFPIGPMVCHPEFIVMPNGLPMWYKDLQYIDTGGDRTELVYRGRGREWVRLWGSKLDENVCQSLARSIMAEQAIEISKEFRIILLVHDEVVYLAKEDEADAALEFGLAAMRKAPSWCSTIPLDAEGVHSHRYIK